MLFVIFLLLFSGFTYSQDSGTPAVELTFYTVNVQGGPIMNLQLNAQSSVWGWASPSTYFLTHDYDEVVYTPDYNNMPPQQAAGFDFITTTYGTPGYPVFAYGLYKATSNRTNKYFFLDYRDDKISFYQPPYYGDMIDLWIKYEYSSDKFFYSSVNSTSNFVEIQNAQVLNFWEIKQKGNPSTDQFPNFWQNCLSVVNDGSNHPRLVWGAYPADGISFNVTGYNIYRTIRTFRDPPYGQFQKIASVSSSTFSFIDLDYSIGSGWYGFYKVTAKDGTVESEYTNTAMTTIDAFGKEVQLNNNRIMNSDYTTVSNYPNPFNPTTTIKYQLAESGNVRLVVTNSLGEEVNVLEEGLMEAGEYSVVFNSENLPSGIYICSLVTNRGITSNKMLLLR